jgi:hypothetical protein
MDYSLEFLNKLASTLTLTLSCLNVMPSMLAAQPASSNTASRKQTVLHVDLFTRQNGVLDLLTNTGHDQETLAVLSSTKPLEGQIIERSVSDEDGDNKKTLENIAEVLEEAAHPDTPRFDAALFH